MDIDTGIPPTQPRPLPVWGVATRSYDYVWENRTRLAGPVAVVMTLAFAGNLADAYLDPLTVADGTESMPAIAASLGASAVNALIAAALAVGIHRWVLLDEARAGLGMLRWDWNFRRYVVTVIAFAILSLGPLCLAAGIASAMLSGSSGDSLAGAALAGLVWLPVSFRFSLALPGAALGNRRGFRLSWRATRGNTWRLFFLTIALTIPFGIVEIVSGVFQVIGSASIISQFPGLVLASVAEAVYATACVVSLSLSYDILVRGGDGQGLAR